MGISSEFSVLCEKPERWILLVNGKGEKVVFEVSCGKAVEFLEKW